MVGVNRKQLLRLRRYTRHLYSPPLLTAIRYLWVPDPVQVSVRYSRTLVRGPLRHGWWLVIVLLANTQQLLHASRRTDMLPLR